jgi:predicted DsbA family dithiol-disulfide isomerase
MNETEKAKTFSPASIKEKAKSLGIDATRFAQCFDSKVELAKIQEDIGTGQKLGLTGTPLLILNGKKYQGGFSPEAFVSAFERELAAVK